MTLHERVDFELLPRNSIAVLASHHRAVGFFRRHKKPSDSQLYWPQKSATGMRLRAAQTLPYRDARARVAHVDQDGGPI